MTVTKLTDLKTTINWLLENGEFKDTETSYNIAMNSINILEEQLSIPRVVESKTMQKVAIVGCGSASLSAARFLTDKGLDPQIINIDDANERGVIITNRPEPTEPLTLINPRPINYFEEPQNRATHRKNARNKKKKRK